MNDLNKEIDQLLEPHLKNIPLEIWNFIEKELHAIDMEGSDNADGGFTYTFAAAGTKFELTIKSLN